MPLIFSFLLPESPKYLHANKKIKEAKEAIHQIAQLNLQKDVNLDNVHIQHAFTESTHSNINQGKWFGLYDLWNDKVTLVNTVAMAYLWGFYTFGHHCLIFMVKYVPGNKYALGLAIAFGVTIAPLITRVIQNYLSSKQIYLLFSILSVVASFLHVVAFDEESIAALIMIIFIAICVDAIGYTNYYVEYEYFSPKVATLAYGICSMTGRTAAIFAPIVVEEAEKYQIMIFLGLSIL